MSKKGGYVAGVVTILAIIAWYFSSNNQSKQVVADIIQKETTPEEKGQSQNIKKILNTNSSANSSNRSKDHNRSTSKPSTNSPALVIDYPYTLMTVDDLLDPNDRTTRSKVMLNRHNQLLTNLYNLKIIQQQNIPIESISVANLQEWTQTLISDLILNNAIFQQLPISEELTVNDSFDPSLLPESNQLSELINNGYFEAVKQLAVKVAVVTNFTDESNKKQFLIYQIADLSRQAKKQSNVFLLTKMKAYFKDEQYSLKQKLDFAQAIANTRDSKLISSVTQYFDYVLTLPQYQKQQKNINHFIESLPRD
jgi:hypothetical protein